MDDPLPSSDQPNTPKASFDDAAIMRADNKSLIRMLLQIANDQADALGKLESRVKDQEVHRSNPNTPARDIRFHDKFFNVTRMGEALNVTMDEDEIRSTFPPLPPVGPPIMASCPDTWVMTDWTCYDRPGLAPRIVIFEIHTTTCLTRGRYFDFCCVECPGSESGSGSYTHGLDQWAGPCSDTGSGSGCDGTNFVYLEAGIFDSLYAKGYDNPIIQLDDEGFCYQLIQRNVTAVATAFTTFTFYDVCTDSDCEEAAPCTWASPPASITVTDVDFGTFQNNGPPCADCTNSGQPASTSIVFDSFSESGTVAALSASAAVYITTSPGVAAAASSVSIGLDKVGCKWFLRFSPACPSSLQICFIKEFGATASGTYTLAPYGTGTYETNTAYEGCGTPGTITVP